MAGSKKRRVLGVVGAGLGVLLSAALFLALRPAERFIFGSVAVGAGEAVFLTRRNTDSSTYFWLELVGADGTLRWSAEITPAEPRDALGFTSVAATADRLIVLVERGGEPGGPAVLALDRADGKKLWETPLPGVPASSGAGRIGPMVLVDASRAYIVHEVREGGAGAGPGAGPGAGEEVSVRLTDQIDVLALDTGTRLWGFAALDGERLENAQVRLGAPDRLFLATVFGPLVELDGRTGAVVRRLEVNGIRCAGAGEVVGLSDGAVVRVPFAAGAPLRRHVLPPGFRAPTSCGLRGDDVVIGLEAADASGSALTRFDAASGAPRWHVSLGARSMDSPALGDDRLPRFLPVAVWGSDTPGGPIRKELVVVDLDAGTIVTRVDISHENAGVFATAERGYVLLSVSNSLLAVDPATGTFAAATAFPGAYVHEVRAEDIRFGHLWIPGSDWARPDALPWAAYDLAAARVTHAHGTLAPADVTATLFPRLGL